jgi:cold shock protein
VRVWHDAEGWGVVDCAGTPGGCWVGFGDVLVGGVRTLQPGQEVELEHEPAAQDGCAYRAVRVWPAGAEPVEPTAGPPGPAYTSTLTLTYDDDPR